MRLGEKGQVTIPIELRRELGLQPGSDVEFERHEDGLLLRKRAGSRRGDQLVDRLRGTSRSGMTTDELLALTRT